MAERAASTIEQQRREAVRGAIQQDDISWRAAATTTAA